MWLNPLKLSTFNVISPVVCGRNCGLELVDLPVPGFTCYREFLHCANPCLSICNFCWSLQSTLSGSGSGFKKSKNEACLFPLLLCNLASIHSCSDFPINIYSNMCAFFYSQSEISTIFSRRLPIFGMLRHQRMYKPDNFSETSEEDNRTEHYRTPDSDRGYSDNSPWTTRRLKESKRLGNSLHIWID